MPPKKWGELLKAVVPHTHTFFEGKMSRYLATLETAIMTADMPRDSTATEESGDESSGPNSPPVAALRRTKFDDEEDDDDVLDSWDAAEDSEVEREKAKKAEEAKLKAAEEAKKNKKSKGQRIAEIQAERQRRAAEDDDFEEETEAERRERLRRTEKESDMKHAEDLFGDIGVPAGRKATLAGTAVQIDPNDPTKTANIAEMPLFNPMTKTQFEHLRTTLTPILANNAKKAHYGLFMQEFTKSLAKELPSDQIKKIASALTALGNEKMKEEKAAQGGNKKSKAAKTKVSAVVSRAPAAETETYEDDAFGDVRPLASLRAGSVPSDLARLRIETCSSSDITYHTDVAAAHPAASFACGEQRGRVRRL
ncbi:hypothetical protein CkaCkLH20_05833 [Colletotrichum karsti]|uniref:Eukaryotic translation initiation factor 3 subunit J n=1 Tax=Colletotrichum karsti TaxID=1095194 RepID=A0A9P6I5W3_9PEZI|nr:uncharacterized protein CkaCkLH20_05833 [Colletotrichum karsti]KAF9876425.1 hypothetical protein CkaCkLH20_05833 [Colletotrichum karsti]